MLVRLLLLLSDAATEFDRPTIDALTEPEEEGMVIEMGAMGGLPFDGIGISCPPAPSTADVDDVILADTASATESARDRC